MYGPNTGLETTPLCLKRSKDKKRADTSLDTRAQVSDTYASGCTTVVQSGGRSPLSARGHMTHVALGSFGRITASAPDRAALSPLGAAAAYQYAFPR